MRLLVLAVLLLPSVLCAAVSGKYRMKAQDHKKAEVGWRRVHSSPGMEDPDLYDAQGNEYRKLANRWLIRAVLGLFLGGALAFWLQQQ